MELIEYIITEIINRSLIAILKEIFIQQSFIIKEKYAKMF